ncbi:MAG: hypothetical protein WEA35_05150 [Candidatus Nanopelagicales bacterium]
MKRVMGGVAPVALAFVVMALSASPAHAESVELCRFDASVLPEISGLAASAIHDDVVWAHNDSGGGALLYAIDTQTCDVLATLTIRGISARDPEALAAGTASDGTPVLWWGDFGDNTGERRYVEIHNIPEPVELRDADVRATTHRIRRDPPEDAEALLADGDRLWMIGKGLISGTVWRLPHPLPADGTARAVSVGVEEGLVTDAAMRPGGGYAVRDYTEARIYAGLPPGDLIDRMPLPAQVQGEAMTWTTDGSALIIASEGDDRLLLVPVDVAVTPSPTATPSPIATPSPTVVSVLDPVDRVGSFAVMALAIGAGVFVLSIVGVVVISRARRHN